MLRDASSDDARMDSGASLAPRELRLRLARIAALGIRRLLEPGAAPVHSLDSRGHPSVHVSETSTTETDDAA